MEHPPLAFILHKPTARSCPSLEPSRSLHSKTSKSTCPVRPQAFLFAFDPTLFRFSLTLRPLLLRTAGAPPFHHDHKEPGTQTFPTSQSKLNRVAMSMQSRPGMQIEEHYADGCQSSSEHSQPMVAPPTTTDDSPRGQNPLTDRCHLASREHHMEWPGMQWTTPIWTAHGWSTTPPFPTPALTASSLSSSSFYGERSPVLAPGSAGHYPRRNLDVPCMTSLPPARSLEDVASHQTLTSKNRILGGEQLYSAEPLSYQPYDEDVTALSSSMKGLDLSEFVGQLPARSTEPASQHIASSLTEHRPQAPLLIPMQPTGAGVPLTSVVETLSSKGSKAAAEDPETVAAAFKLRQWGIG